MLSRTWPLSCYIAKQLASTATAAGKGDECEWNLLHTGELKHPHKLATATHGVQAADGIRWRRLTLDAKQPALTIDLRVMGTFASTSASTSATCLGKPFSREVVCIVSEAS